MRQYHSRQFKLLEISQYTTELCGCKPRQLCEVGSVCLANKNETRTRKKQQYPHKDGKVQVSVGTAGGIEEFGGKCADLVTLFLDRLAQCS